MYKEELIPKIIPNTKYIKEIDIPLLLNLFDFQTPTQDEESQIRYFNYIVDIFIDKYNIDCIVDQDEYGNIYLTKGDADFYPCVVSHLDVVHSFDANFKTYRCDDFIIGLSNGKQCGMGADPKAGLYILLQLLLKFDNIKCVLFLNEEQSCLGSKEADMNFFKNCSYVLQFDRRSFTSDVIEHTNGIQVLSEDFKELLHPIMNDYGYNFNYGTCTDAGQLTQNGININTMNVSNGSFSEHCDNEVCSISHLLNALNFGIDILSTIENKQYVFKKQEIQNSGEFYRGWRNETYYNVPESINTGIGKNEGFCKEVTKEEVEWINEQICPECCMQDTLTTISESDVYCNYCGVEYFIPNELIKKKQNNIHSFSEFML
jgi:hypothetical protein